MVNDGGKGEKWSEGQCSVYLFEEKKIRMLKGNAEEYS